MSNVREIMIIPPEERLAVLEENMKLMASVFSRQAGQLQAVHAALRGFLIFAGDIGDIRTQIELELEKQVALNLGESVNQEKNDAFDALANDLRLIMDSMNEYRAKQAGYKL
jgi:CheY-specific phosphatase CheX